jgi:TOBE domain
LAPGLSDGPVDIMIRPETIHLDRAQAGDAEIVHAEFYGHDQLVRARLGDGTLLDVRLLGPRPDLTIGAQVDVRLTEPVHFFRADSAVAVSPYCGIVTSDSPQVSGVADSLEAP